MYKILFFSLVAISINPLLSVAADNIEYGYDRINKQIFAKDGSAESTLRFEEDYTGNPTYGFSYFNGRPAIVADSRSLYDSTVYAVLNYRNSQLELDCLYIDMKSKINGISVKEGSCGLKDKEPEKYKDIIDRNVSSIQARIDSIDTSPLLRVGQKYISAILYKDINRTIYKIYTDRFALLSDKYLIASKMNNLCEVYENSPWIVYNTDRIEGVEIITDIDDSGRLTPAISSKNKNSICSSYPAVKVKSSKAHLYDSKKELKKSYLISGDELNLRAISEDKKWCSVVYINKLNKRLQAVMHCKDLDLF